MGKLNGIIINPNSVNSVIASSKIANFLSSKFDIPIYGKHNYRTYDIKRKLDFTFLMNSGFGCVLDSPKEYFGTWIPEVVKKSNNPIYVTNDYKLLYPCGHTRDINPKKYIYWSTIADYNGRLCKNLIYVNWNKLSYDPLPLRKEYEFDKCIYWGAYRLHRVNYFKEYLNNKKVTISTSKRAEKGFVEVCPEAKIVRNFERLYSSIRRYACTIYLEDYTKKYCSPANRFYEAISAGVPMFFQAESVNHMKTAGYDVRKYVVNNKKELLNKIKNSGEVMKEQSLWRRDYIKELNEEVDKAIKEIR